MWDALRALRERELIVATETDDDINGADAVDELGEIRDRLDEVLSHAPANNAPFTLPWVRDTAVCGRFVCRIRPMNRRDTNDSWVGLVRIDARPDGVAFEERTEPCASPEAARAAVTKIVEAIVAPFLARSA